VDEEGARKHFMKRLEANSAEIKIYLYDKCRDNVKYISNLRLR